MPELTDVVVTQLTARITELEAALRSVLDQPETAEAYDAMMQRITDALSGARVPSLPKCIPVAWMLKSAGQLQAVFHQSEADEWARQGFTVTPLYA
jgi:hypothetical protein